MLELDPKKRITASKALKHPYFITEPLPCEPKQITLLDGDSHEFFIRIQQGNKALVLSKNNSMLNSSVGMTKTDKPIIISKKRHLVIEESTLAPSTKEYSFVGTIK